MGEFEKAKPFLIQTLNQKDTDYSVSLLLLSRVYDQTGEPEKAILALQELLAKPYDAALDLRARTLLLKNQYKVSSRTLQSSQKKNVDLIRKISVSEKKKVLDDLAWVMDFHCDQYCLSEIDFLKEIQLQYIYLIEDDADLANQASEILKSRYLFFEGFLSKAHLSESYRKQIAVAILDGLKKLRDLELNRVDVGSVRAAKTIYSLGAIEKRTESWLYK